MANRPIRNVVIVGAGQMGAGIAQVACQAGYRTHLTDAQPKALERGVQRILDFWDAGVAKGKTTPQQKQQWLGNLHWRGQLPEVAGDADLVIEAVPEILDLKRQTFALLDEAAPDHCILATNTSSLSVTKIAAATQRPDRVLGMHFFNPVPLMKLLELVRHDAVSETTLRTARDVGAAMGKTVIVANDVPGFATSRLGIVLGNEAMRMLEEGVASAKDIDIAMKLGYGHPMGPLELSDLVGLDVRKEVSEYLHQQFGGDHYKPPAIMDRLVAAGHFGKKTGKGFYDWSDGTPKERTLP